MSGSIRIEIPATIAGNTIVFQRFKEGVSITVDDGTGGKVSNMVKEEYLLAVFKALSYSKGD